MVRFAVPEDASAILSIYSPYVRNTDISFELEPPSVEEMKRRIKSISADYPYFVMENDNEIEGYAYASRWHSRKAYDKTVEVSVYIREDCRGHGVGNALYERLLRALRKRRIHTVVACIALPNEPSRRLHERFGFQESGRLREVGRKFNRWIDVGYWVLTLNDPDPASR